MDLENIVCTPNIVDMYENRPYYLGDMCLAKDISFNRIEHEYICCVIQIINGRFKILNPLSTIYDSKEIVQFKQQS